MKIEAERKRAHRKVRVIGVLATLASFIFLVLFTVAFLTSPNPENPFTGQTMSGIGGVLTAILVIVLMSWLIYYSVWSFLWGLTTVWPWWMRFPDRLGLVILTSPVGWLMLVFFFLSFGLMFSWWYGFLGGAIYQYKKARRIAKVDPVLSPATA